MLFSIYDYKNRFLSPEQDAAADSAEIYTGTTAAEKKYGYMRNAPGVLAEGADIGRPYYAEFRIAEAAGGDVTLSVEGAKPVTDADGFPKFNADGTPDNSGLAWSPVGTLEIPAAEAGDSVPHRVAFSDSRNKWFRAKAANARVSAFLMRG